MTADMLTGDDSLASQCLAFCQTLASQGMDFHFSLTINSTFSFSLDTRKTKGNSTLVKKRSSPSTQRRNARRREEFLKRKLNFDPLSPSASDAPTDTSSASTPAGSAGVASSPTSFKATSSPLPSLQPSLEIPCILQARQLCVKTFNSEEDHKNHMMKAHYGGACINCQLWDPRRKCKERKSCRTVYEYYRPGKYWTWQLAGSVFGKIDGVDHRCDE